MGECLSLIPKGVLKARIKAFQKRLRIPEDAAMIRVLLTFIYLTGVKWLRPSLLIPAKGDPFIFAVKGEYGRLEKVTGLNLLSN